MLDFLKFSITVFGLKAPWFSWAAALGLIVWPAVSISRYFTLSARRKDLCLKLSRDIDAITAEYPRQRGYGLDINVIDRLREVFAGVPFMAAKWPAFRSRLVIRPPHEQDAVNQFWMTESVASLFPEDKFLGEQFNLKNFLAIPGICTGIGLLMTFTAILVGLLDVSIVDNKVQGLQNLIGGLSGKFVSSIAALFSATVFTLLEKKESHRLNAARHKLILSLDTLVPLRTESLLLGDISQKISAQTDALSNLYTSLAGISKGSSQNLEPVLEQIASAIDGLSKISGASQTAPAQIESLIAGLQTSLADSQKAMAESFDKMSSSLSGAGQGVAGGAGEGGAAVPAEMVEAMNGHFAANQEALEELVNYTRRLSENEYNNSAARSIAVSMFGLAAFICFEAADFLGVGRFLKFGHLQTVGCTFAALIILSGLMMHPALRSRVPSKLIIGFGVFIIAIGCFPVLLFPSTAGGFGMLQLTVTIIGGVILAFGLSKMLYKGKPKAAQKPAQTELAHAQQAKGA